MSLKYTWRGKELDSLFQKAALTALTAISTELATLCQDAVSEPYPPPSVPGQPPHRRTGRGQAAIQSETYVSKLQSALVIRRSGIHMLYLEYGTHRILPRPWFKPTLMTHRNALELLGNTEFARIMRT